MQKRFKGLGVWVAMLVVAYLIYMFAVGFGASQTKMVYSDLVNSITVSYTHLTLPTILQV